MRLELRQKPERRALARRDPAFCLFRLAVAVGFEPTEAFTSHAFEACSFGRSDTPPRTSIQESRGEAAGTGGRERTVIDAGAADVQNPRATYRPRLTGCRSRSTRR